MNRYNVLAAVAGILAIILFVTAFVFKLIALAAILLVLCLVVSAVYFAVAKKRAPQP